MAQAKFADRGIECKTIHTTARGIYQHRGRPIHHISGSHLVFAGLQKIGGRGYGAFFRNTAVYGEYGAYGNIHIYITTAVERVEETNIFGVAAHRVIESHEIVELFAGNTGATDT